MTLKEFIESSLVEITEGIVTANKRIEEKGAFIVTTDVMDHGKNSTSELIGARDKDGKEHLVTKVDFDVYLNVVESNSKGINASAALSVLSIGLGNNNKSQNENANRVKFTIPLALPIIEE